MESNEQTELTSKIEADSWIESRLTALRDGEEVMERSSKKEKELMDTDNSVLIVGGRGVGGGRRGYRGEKC